MSSSPPRGGFTVDSGAAGDGTPSAPRGEVVSGGHGRQASEFTPEDRKVVVRTHDLCVLCGFGLTDLVFIVQSRTCPCYISFLKG